MPSRSISARYASPLSTLLGRIDHRARGEQGLPERIRRRHVRFRCALAKSDAHAGARERYLIIDLLVRDQSRECLRAQHRNVETLAVVDATLDFRDDFEVSRDGVAGLRLKLRRQRLTTPRTPGLPSSLISAAVAALAKDIAITVTEMNASFPMRPSPMRRQG